MTDHSLSFMVRKKSMSNNILRVSFLIVTGTPKTHLVFIERASLQGIKFDFVEDKLGPVVHYNPGN